MPKKKIAIIGKGTAGVLSTMHFARWTDCDIELYYDSNIKPQPVGEGSQVCLPRNLNECLYFKHHQLEEIDGYYKSSVYKSGWSTGKDYHSYFAPPNVAYHFNAGKLQEYIVDSLKDRIKVIDKNVTADNVDADFIMDCSGKPSNYDDCYLSDYISVNSVHVTQCYWDFPRFSHTLTIARPYGWVFGIPLQNRCSIGYLYNSNINTLEEVQEDVKNIFKQYNLNPSQNTNSFSFKNYFRKKNFTDKVVYNGNASFFLEPLEATSITLMDIIQRNAFDVWFNNKSLDAANKAYSDEVQGIENIIMMHYYSGSIYDTEFWKYARDRGEKNMDFNMNNPNLIRYLMDQGTPQDTYGTWPQKLFTDNLKGLGIYEKLLDKYAKTKN